MPCCPWWREEGLSPPSTSGKCISCVARCSFADDTIYSRYIVVFKYLLAGSPGLFHPFLFLPPRFLSSLSPSLLSSFCRSPGFARVIDWQLLPDEQTESANSYTAAERIERLKRPVRSNGGLIIGGQSGVASNSSNSRQPRLRLPLSSHSVYLSVFVSISLVFYPGSRLHSACCEIWNSEI